MSLVDEYLFSQGKKPREAGVLYITELTGPCLRAAYLGIIEPKEYPIETQRIFESGRVLEDWFVHILENSPGIRVLSKQFIARYKTEDFEIHGRIDALCQENDGAIVVHEVKSAKSTAYINGPKEDHLLQIHFYMNCLGVDFGSVDYLDKTVMLHGQGDSVEKVFPVRRDPGMFAEVVRRGRELNEALKCHESPPKNKCWKCDGYCLYKSECEGGLKLV